ncbi:hypothetical protein AAC387_Pa05g0931 [Persea americana]
MAATEAWQPCVTTLPRGHVSIRSLRRTTYWTRTSVDSRLSSPAPVPDLEGGGYEMDLRPLLRRLWS